MKILVMVLAWAMIFAAGFILPRFIEPTGDGFTRGLNRLPYFFALHCLGLMVALLSAAISLRSKAEIAVWLLVTGFVPLAAYALLIGLVVVVYIGAMISGM
ncbi:MAG: hypothetical protein Kow0031_17670 [Anaerolineae bacterium]